MPLPDPTPFLARLLAALEPAPGALGHLVIDHLCYRTATVADYERLRDALLATNDLLAESVIGGRRIATFRLAVPYVYGERRIGLVELPEPKPGSPYPAGWEHAEFVTDRPLADFATWAEQKLTLAATAYDRRGLTKARNADLRLRLPGGLSVKFHERPLDEVIRSERNELPPLP